MTSLPPQSTPFVGREAELADIARLLAEPTCRLLTLVGPGGIGKTRLAIEAASHVDVQDGAHFITLQALESPEMMAEAVASALDVPSYGGDTRRQLLSHLCDKAVLLVLDNLEQLIDDLTILAEMLAAAPHVKLLATSREPVGLAEEWLYPVRGLRHPTDDDDDTPENYSAINLFVQSARRRRPDFALEDEQRGVKRICALVDGMPLGIELAASWVRTLSCDEIAGEIERGIDLLETQARNVPERHRSMRLMLTQAWARLTKRERDAFQRLSIFRGGFTRAAGEAVAGASARTLAALVDKSWLRYDAATRRYTVHELLRQYGEERLNEDANEVRIVCDRHCSYYTTFLSACWERLAGRDAIAATNEIHADIDNVRLAWSWAIEQRKAAEIDAAAKSLGFFFQGRSRYPEGNQFFTQAVAAFSSAEGEAERLRGKLLGHLGSFHYSLGLPDAKAILQDGIAICRRFGERRSLASSLHWLAMYISSNEGGYCEAALDALEESLAIYSDLNDRYGMGDPLFALSLLHHDAAQQGVAGAYERAQHYGEACLAVSEQAESPSHIACGLIALAKLAFTLKKYDQFWVNAAAALEIVERLDSIWAMSQLVNSMAMVAFDTGDLKGAKRWVLQGLQANYDSALRNSFFTLRHLHMRAKLWLKERHPEPAYELLGAIDRHESQNVAARTDYDALRLLDVDLPPHLAAAVEWGRERSFENIVKDVIAELRQSLDDAAPAASDLLNPLTKREIEILCLTAEGLSNRQIAEQLFLSTGTVKWYLSEIYSKLGVGSRTQAVAQARALNLLS